MKHISHGHVNGYGFTAPSPQGMPGFDVFHKILLKVGLDPNIVVNLGMFITVLASLGGFLVYAWAGVSRIWDFISANLTSSATIHSSDQTYLYVMKWLVVNKISTDCRLFCVTSKKNPHSARVKRYSFYNGPRGASGEQDEDSDEEDDFGPKIRYSPAPGTSYFWYKKRLIIISRKVDLAFYAGDAPDETMILTTIGRSPVLLRSLLDEARKCYLASQRRKTTVFNAIVDGRFDKRWDSGRSRPSRSISTVIMHERDKETILNDAREYLNPATAKWYSERGLPYRRGYLFYGPPGTGKTSLTVALAGELNLALYIFNLGIGGGLTDESLGYLFQCLPKKCIVLLEDIDCVGIGRLGAASNSDSPLLLDSLNFGGDERSPRTRRTSKVSSNGEGKDGDQTAQRPKKQQQQSNKSDVPTRGAAKAGGSASSRPLPILPSRHQNEQKISFSGLLNAIDGVGSHEGRILIMTTNHIDRLDAALIRPGRVDMRIEFGYATKDISARVFKELYKGTPGFPQVPSENEVTDNICFSGSQNKNIMDDDMLFQPSPVQEKCSLYNFSYSCVLPNNIQDLGQAFANEIPPEMFTPAELQGYLIRHKHNPIQAVVEVSEWVKEKIREKNRDSGIAETIPSRKVSESRRQEEEEDKIEEITESQSASLDSEEIEEWEKKVNGNSGKLTNGRSKSSFKKAASRTDGISRKPLPNGVKGYVNGISGTKVTQSGEAGFLKSNF